MSRPWYQDLADGTVVPLAFLKIDLQGSTALRETLPKDEMARAMDRYRKLVEGAMFGIDALPNPPHWFGDGAAFVLGGDRALVLLVEAALGLLRDIRTLPGAELHVRIAIGFDDAAYQAQVGTIKSTQFDFAGHLEGVCPKDSLLISEEAYLELRSHRELMEQFEYFGMRADDRCPGFVAPRGRQRSDAKNADLLVPEAEDTYRTRRALLDLYDEPAFRQIRFIGVRQFERIGGVELLEAFRPLMLRRRAEQPFVSRFVFSMDPSRESSSGVTAADIRKTVRSRIAAGSLERWAADSEPPASIESPAEVVREGGVLEDVDLVARVLGSHQIDWHPFEPAAGQTESFLDLLPSNRRVVVLGDPGSGKSTLLRYVTLVVAQGGRAARLKLGIDEALLPLHFGVGRLAALLAEAGNKSPSEILADYFRGRGVSGTARVIDESLENGSALLLFDGLDEVPLAADRRAVERFIEALSSQHPSCRVIVTARIVGFSPLSIRDAGTWAVEPLDEAGARALVESFYTAYYRVEFGGDVRRAEAKGVSDAASLIGALTSRPALQHFRENPLLLTLAALVHTQMGRLPRYRARLYQVAAQTLIEAWASARLAVPALNPLQPVEYDVEGLAIFPSLALELHSRHSGGLIREDELIAFIAARLPLSRELAMPARDAAARDLLRRVTSGGSILLERGPGRWGFLHQTLQEYLAAKALAGDDALREVYFRDHLYNPRFEEIWRLVAGEIGIVQERPPAAARLIAGIFADDDVLHASVLHQNVVLAGECLADTAVADVGLVDRLSEAVAGVVLEESDAPPTDVIDKLLLEFASLPESSAIAARLLAGLDGTAPGRRRRAVRGLTSLRADYIDTAVGLVERDPDSDVAKLATYWVDRIGGVSLEAAVRMLGSSSGRAAHLGAWSLERLGAVSELVTAWHSAVRADQSLMVPLAGILWRLGQRDLVLDMLSHGPPSSSIRAAAGLAGTLDAVSVPSVARTGAAPASWMVRIPLALVIAEVRCAASTDAIRAWAHEGVVDDDPIKYAVACFVVGLLGEAGDMSDAPFLLELLDHKGQEALRASAARALGQLRVRRALPRLTTIATDGRVNSVLRVAAIQSLGEMGSIIEVSPIVEILRGPADSAVRVAAASALGTLRATEPRELLLAALEEDLPELQVAAAVALERLVHVDIERAVLRLLSDTSNPLTRFLAAHVACHLGAREVVSVVLARGLQAQAIPKLPLGLPTPHSYGEILWRLSLLPPYRTPPPSPPPPKPRKRPTRAKPTPPARAPRPTRTDSSDD